MVKCTARAVRVCTLHKYYNMSEYTAKEKLTVEKAAAMGYNFIDCIRYYFPAMEGYQAADYLMDEVKEVEADKVLDKLYELYEQDGNKTVLS